jgi:hypothetical protein
MNTAPGSEVKMAKKKTAQFSPLFCNQEKKRKIKQRKLEIKTTLFF